MPLPYEPAGEFQTQALGPADTLIDVVEAGFFVPGRPFTGSVRVPVAAGWPAVRDQLIAQRLADYETIAAIPEVAMIRQEVEVNQANDLTDVVTIGFETIPEGYFGQITVPLAAGWPAAAQAKIAAMIQELQSFVAG